MSLRPKSYFHDRVGREMDGRVAAEEWSARQKIVLACRMLGLEGHGSGLAGQITARADEPGTFWSLAFGIGFDEATEAALVRVDDDLRVLEGDGTANPGARFHLWIYRARPELGCVVHTHAPYVSALSILGEELVAAHMDTTPFYEDCAYLPDWPGVPIGDDEGEIISRALGAKRSILLAHHGQLSVGATIEEAAYLAISIERAARMQLLARAVGPIKPIPPALGREAHDFMLRPSMIDATFAYFARQALRADPDCIAADRERS